MRNEDDGFQWGNTGEYTFEDLAEYSDEDVESSSFIQDDEVLKPDVTSGAGMPLYQAAARDRRKFARRGTAIDRRFPVWFYGVLGVLVILFVVLGIALGRHANSTANSNTNYEVLQQQASEQIATLTNEQKVAQLIFTTPYYLTWEEGLTGADEALTGALATYPVGGVFFDGSNISDSGQLSSMISGVKGASSLPLFAGVSEATSDNSVLLNSDSSSPAALHESGSTSDAYAAGLAIGGTLNGYGVDVNFTPLAAVVPDPASPYYKYSYGSDASTVADMMSRTITGIEGQGVSCAVKYFPGTGMTFENQNDSLIICDYSWDELLANDVVPFKSAVDSGVDFVQMSNIAYSQITGGTPATLSSAMVIDHLRKGLGFQGVIVSGRLDVPSVTNSMSPAEAAVAAIQAGCDMVFCSGDVAATYDTLLAAVNEGRISQEQLDAAVTHIYMVRIAREGISD